MSRTRHHPDTIPKGPERRRSGSATARAVAGGTRTPNDAPRRTAIALVCTLAMLGVARAALTFVPSMWAWSLNLQRFLPPIAAWPLWALAGVALLPLVAGLVAPRVDRLGDWTARSGVAPFAWAALTVALVLLLPDDTQSTGDFLLRRRAIEEGLLPSREFPQLLPLDVWLHHALPRWLFVHHGIAASVTARAWGAIDAALLASCAVAFARASRFAGPAAFAVTGGVVFGGSLALFTGYGKGLAELTVLVVAVAAFGARVVRDGSGHLRLGLAVALAIAVHRAAVLLLPAALVAWAMAARVHGMPRRAWLAIALPIVSGAFVAGRIAAIVTGYDASHHFTAAPGIVRGSEVANALVLVAPLAVLVPVLLATFGSDLPRRREMIPTAVLALALLALAIAIVPQQGIVRDWDVFAPAGMSLALLAAWLAGDTIRGVPATSRGIAALPAGGIALAVVLAAAVPSVQWLVHLNDVNFGLARVAAVIAEPPSRSDVERARLWDFVGIRTAWLDEWSTAADAFEHSAALLPTPRVLEQWARAEIHRGDWLRARDVYERLVARDSLSVHAWRGYAAVVTRLDDRERSRNAVRHILALAPADSGARSILEYLDRTGPR